MNIKGFWKSALTVLVCLSLISGATYAIFTDGGSVGIVATNGKVEVEAGIIPGSLITYSVQPIEGTNGYISALNPAGSFANGGNAKLSGLLFNDSAESTIRDTDMAKDMVSYGLSQANQNVSDGIGLCRVTIRGLMDAIEIIDLAIDKGASGKDMLKLTKGIEYIKNYTSKGVALATSAKYFSGEKVVIQYGGSVGEAYEFYAPDLGAEAYTFSETDGIEKLNAAITALEGEITRINGVIDDLCELSSAEGNGDGIETSMYSNLSLSGMLPGDTAEFAIKVTNKSDVAIRYRTVWGIYGDLRDALTVTVKSSDGTLLSPFDPAAVSSTVWTNLGASSEPVTVIDYIFVSVTMNIDADEQYADKNCNISFRVEAVQGNTDDSIVDTQAFAVYSVEEKTLTLYSRKSITETVNQMHNGEEVRLYPIAHSWNGMTQSTGEAALINRMAYTVGNILNQGGLSRAAASADNGLSENPDKISSGMHINRPLGTPVPWNKEVIDKVVFADNLPIAETANWFANQNTLTEVVFQDGIVLERISFGTFMNCTALTAVTLPEGLKIIESSAFSGCTSLSSVTLPGTLEEIDCNVFKGCSSLTEITFPASLKMIGENSFASTGLTSAEFLGDMKAWVVLDTIYQLPAACKINKYFSSNSEPEEITLGSAEENAEALIFTYVGKGWCEKSFYEEQVILSEGLPSIGGNLSLIQ